MRSALDPAPHSTSDAGGHRRFAGELLAPAAAAGTAARTGSNALAAAVSEGSITWSAHTQ